MKYKIWEFIAKGLFITILILNGFWIFNHLCYCNKHIKYINYEVKNNDRFIY